MWWMILTFICGVSTAGIALALSPTSRKFWFPIAAVAALGAGLGIGPLLVGPWPAMWQVGGGWIVWMLWLIAGLCVAVPASILVGFLISQRLPAEFREA